MIVRLALAAAVVAAAATTVVAQSDPIAARKAIMKTTGQQTAIGAKMIKGEEPFDLNKAKAIFAEYQDAAAKMPGLFPDSAKSGGESTASPKI